MQTNDDDDECTEGPRAERVLREALTLLIRCRDSASRMTLDLYNDIQEFIHKHDTSTR